MLDPADPSRFLAGTQRLVEDEVRDPKFGEFFTDPWTEETRGTKRNLLVLGIVGITMAAAKIYPTAIDAFGLHTQGIDPSALLIVLAVVVAYLTLTYAMYVYTDFMRTYGSKDISTTVPEMILPRSREADESTVAETSETSVQEYSQPDLSNELSGVSSAQIQNQLDAASAEFMEIQRLKGTLKNIQLVRVLADAFIPLLTGVASFVWLLWRGLTI
jgi:hypothetical protein